MSYLTYANGKPLRAWTNPYSIKSPLAPGDPFIGNVVLLLEMNGSNGGTNFIDSSPLALPVTRMGTSPPTISTAQSKYGEASGLFYASNAYLNVNNVALALGTSPFTIECFAYKTSVVSANAGLFAFGISNVNFGGLNGYAYNGNIYLGGLNGGSLPTNQWVHLAIVREGTGTNQTKVYVNGVLTVSATNSTNYAQQHLNIGAYASAAYCWDGHIDSFRITKGVARYTSNFNPEADTFLT